MSQHLRRKGRDHTRFYILYVLLCLLLMARYGLQIAVPRFLLTLMVAVCALLGSREEILAVAMCCIPWCEAIDLSYALFACTGSFLLKYYKDVRINLSVMVVLCMIVWELLHCFAPGFSIVGFLFSIVTLVFLAVVLCMDLQDLDYGFVIRAMATANAIMCVTLLINLVVQANFNIAAAITGLQRLGMVSSESQHSTAVGTAINPNSLGIICVLSITGLLQLRTMGQNKKTDVFVTLLLLVFGALTSSRTFLVCLLAMAVLLIMSGSQGVRKKLRLIAAILLLAVAALLILNWFFPDLLEYYVKRFQVGEITGGRSKLIQTYHAYILDNPKVMFLGVGRNNFTEKLTETYRIAVNTPHNAVQEIIMAWGIPGLLLFAVLFGMMIVRSGQFNRNHTLLNAIPLLIILLKSMAGQLLTAHYTMLALSYAYLSLCQDFRPKEER